MVFLSHPSFSLNQRPKSKQYVVCPLPLNWPPPVSEDSSLPSLFSSCAHWDLWKSSCPLLFPSLSSLVLLRAATFKPWLYFTDCPFKGQVIVNHMGPKLPLLAWNAPCIHFSAVIHGACFRLRCSWSFQSYLSVTLVKQSYVEDFIYFFDHILHPSSSPH